RHHGYVRHPHAAADALWHAKSAYRRRRRPRRGVRQRVVCAGHPARRGIYQRRPRLHVSGGHPDIGSPATAAAALGAAGTRHGRRDFGGVDPGLVLMWCPCCALLSPTPIFLIALIAPNTYLPG